MSTMGSIFQVLISVGKVCRIYPPRAVLPSTSRRSSHLARFVFGGWICGISQDLMQVVSPLFVVSHCLAPQLHSWLPQRPSSLRMYPCTETPEMHWEPGPHGHNWEPQENHGPCCKFGPQESKKMVYHVDQAISFYPHFPLIWKSFPVVTKLHRNDHHLAGRFEGHLRLLPLSAREHELQTWGYENQPWCGYNGNIYIYTACIYTHPCI